MTERISLNNRGYALVDDADFEWLSRWSWFDRNGYVVRGNGAGRVKWMHREILNVPEELSTDHIDGCKHNNQRSNLRVVTHLQNMWNKPPTRQPKGSQAPWSSYRGVSWDPTGKKWRARITVNEKSISLGSFYCDKEAATAYNEAAKQHYGQYARLNCLERSE